jgi:hypothetical protein
MNNKTDNKDTNMETTIEMETWEVVMKALARMMMVGMAATLASSGMLQASGKATSGAQFLRIGVGARGPAMSGALSPVVDDATSIYYNPAGLARMERKNVQVGYNSYFEDTASQFIGYGHPTAERGAFGVGISMFGVRDIEKRSASAGDADTADLGSFNTQDMAVSVGWADKRELGSKNLHYGAALKYVSSDLETESAVTGAVDMGVMLDMHEAGGLTFSAALLNLGGEMKFANEGDPLPLNFKPGVAYRWNEKKFGNLAVLLDADMLLHDGTVLVQPAIEWTPVSIFSLRGGYQIGRDSDAGGASVGAGFDLSKLHIDYAFVPYGELGDTHRMAVGYKF